eukprot:1036678-Amphidinium_carterae.1
MIRLMVECSGSTIHPEESHGSAHTRGNRLHAAWFAAYDKPYDRLMLQATSPENDCARNEKCMPS